VGTITSSSANSVQFNIINVLYGIENNSNITIWDGATIECTGPHPNYANDLGNIGDTVMCLIEPITSIENPWDVIGEYRRPSLLGGFSTYTNFSAGILFDNAYTFDEVLTLDIADYCCSSLNELYIISIPSLPATTGSIQPINLTGSPAGGTFSGPGVILNAFNPSIAGPGNHTITYTFTEEFGCSFNIQQEILVFIINFNFVNYNLGTISPKITNPIQIEIDVIESDKYTFQIFDLNGKQHYQNAVQLDTGMQLPEIQLNQQLPKGVYLFKIANSRTHTSKKFVVSG